MRGRRLRERAERSCRTIIDFIERETDKRCRIFLLDDFMTKASSLGAELRARLTVQALSPFLAKKVRKRLGRDAMEREITARQLDVLIVTVIPNELLAVQTAFGIDPSRAPTRNENGLRCWESVVNCGAKGQQLSIAISMVGEAGNVSCATACSRLFDIYGVQLAVLVGIAGGLKEKVSLGDVVAAELILDYEYARLEPGGRRKRPRPYTLRPRIARDLQYFSPYRAGWHVSLGEAIHGLRAEPSVELPLKTNVEFVPEYHRGVVLAGEKLIADGSLPELRREYHDRVRAAEMEGAGFARVCNEFDVPWLVFRGISDFGDDDKDTKWQLIAALSAGVAVRTFLEATYEPQDISL